MGFIWNEEKEDDQKFKDHLTKKIDDATTTLSNTNTGLLVDIKKLKKSNKEKEGFEVDEFNRLKTENETLKKKSQEGESEAEKQLRLAREQHSTEMKTLNDRLDKRDKDDQKNKVKSEILEALGVVKCKPSLMKAARRVINSDVTFEDGTPMIGDKTISNYVGDWAKTEEGKNFVLAKKNGGGNANGGGEDNTEDNEKYFDPESSHFNRTTQGKLKKTNPDLHKTLTEKFKK